MKTKFNKILTLVLMLCLSLMACLTLGACNKTIDELQNEYGVLIEGEFEKGAQLVFEKIENEEKAAVIEMIADQAYNKNAEVLVYDISVVKDNAEVQPDGKVKVSIPVENIDVAKKYIVMHVKENGSVEILIPTVSENLVTFETDSFSYFVIAEEEEPKILIGIEPDYSKTNGYIKNFPHGQEGIVYLAESYVRFIPEEIIVWGLYSDGSKEILPQDAYDMDLIQLDGRGYGYSAINWVNANGDPVSEEVIFCYRPSESGLTLTINDLNIAVVEPRMIELDIADAVIDFTDYTVTALVYGTVGEATALEMEVVINYEVELNEYDKDNVKPGDYHIRYHCKGVDIKEIAVLVTCEHSNISDWQIDDNGHFKTCDACGIETSRYTHTAVCRSTEDKHEFYCHVCGYVSISEAHTWDSDYCFTYCVDCGYIDRSKENVDNPHKWMDAHLAHNWETGEEIEGYHAYFCEICAAESEPQPHVTDEDCREWSAHCNECQAHMGRGNHTFIEEDTIFNDENTHLAHCETCGENVSEKHYGGLEDATCQTQAICEGCKMPYGDMADHTYGAGVAGKDENGAEATVFTCTVCGNKEYVYPCSHEWTIWMFDGKDLVQHYRKCELCGEKEWANHVFSGEFECIEDGHAQWCEICQKGHSVVMAHSGGTATCAMQAQCEVCEEYYGDIDEDNHIISEWQASVTDGIYHGRSCDCGEYSESGEHDFGEGYLGRFPDNYPAGGAAIIYTCGTCGYKKYEETECPHDYTGVKAYAGQLGHVLVCNICEQSTYEEPHTYDAGVAGKYPDGSDGAMIYTCTVCGHTKHTAADHTHAYGEWEDLSGSFMPNCHYRECECGDIEYATHTLSSEWLESTPNGHAKECTDCGVAVWGAHDEDGTDESCSICGYTKE